MERKYLIGLTDLCVILTMRMRESAAQNEGHLSLVYFTFVRTDAGQEKQGWGVKHLFRNRHRTRHEQCQHTGKQGHMTKNQSRSREQS